MAGTPLDISISLQSINQKLAAITKVILQNPTDESLYYVLFATIQSIISNSNDDILWGPQIVLTPGTAQEGKRIPDASTLRIRPTLNSYSLEPIVTFELKPGPCDTHNRSLGIEELPSPTSSDIVAEPVHWTRVMLLANNKFKMWYEQLCEQASRALNQQPAKASFPTFFLTGFYFYLIVFSRPSEDSGEAGNISPISYFPEGTEDAGYNKFLEGAHDNLVAKLERVGLKYEIKYFCERYIDRDTRHLTAQFAGALRLATEWENGPQLRESWFTALGEQGGTASEKNIAKGYEELRRAVEHSTAPLKQTIKEMVEPPPTVERQLRDVQRRMDEDDSDYKQDESDGMDADSSNNADTSMSTTSDSPIATRVARDDVHSPRNPEPRQDEAAVASISGNSSDPFASSPGSLTPSSPEAPRRQPRVRKDRHLQFAQVPGDGHSEGEEDRGGQVSPSPMPRDLAGHQTGLIGHTITGGNQAGGRVDTESDMECST